MRFSVICFFFWALHSLEFKDVKSGQLGDHQLVNPCLDKTSKFASLPFCDTTLDVNARVADLVGRLTVKEKISALGTGTGNLDSVGLPGYNWWSEATHGISHVDFKGDTPFASDTALPITTSCSFNRTLWWKTGNQIAREARAFMNAGHAYSTYWAPVVNLVRDPRWGRNIETPGEDPFLSGQYAINFVDGFERDPSDPGHILASSCCKHFVANSMESTNQDGISHARYDFDAQVTMQDLVDSYLPPFQDCVEQGKVSGLMCSYNAVNGVPSCANQWLQNTLARGEWEFDGYITSDCDADGNVFNPHHYLNHTEEEVVNDVLIAGTDVDCGGFVQKHAGSALDKKIISEDLIDERLRNLFRVRMRLGHFDPPGPLQQIKVDEICSDYAKGLSREGMTQSAVLLKNLNFLPLNGKDVKSLAVIGPNLDLSSKTGSYYGPGSPCDHKWWTIVDSFSEKVDNKIQNCKGLDSVGADADAAKIKACVDMASKSDVVVLAIGSDTSLEREGHDRVTIAFHPGQLDLITAVSNVNSNILAVVFGGGAMDITPLLQNPKVKGIIWVAQPAAQIVGVADVVFQDKPGFVVPAGRMSQMIYPSSFTSEVSIFDMNMRPGPSAFPAPGKPNGKGTNPGRTHRFYTGTPVIPFGFGLSYSSFTYEIRSASAVVNLRDINDFLQRHKERTTLPVLKENFIEYTVRVTNTGKFDAADVVLGFKEPPGAGQNGVPKQALFGFERVFLKAGEFKDVYIGAQAKDFSLVDAFGKHYAAVGTHTVRFGVKHEDMHHVETTTTVKKIDHRKEIQ